MVSRYASISKCHKASVNVFKQNNNKWYKISLKIGETNIDSVREHMNNKFLDSV